MQENLYKAAVVVRHFVADRQLQRKSAKFFVGTLVVVGRQVELLGVLSLGFAHVVFFLVGDI